MDVYVCILEADGGELAAAISVGAAALADAGIPMRDLVAACSVVSLPNSHLHQPCNPCACNAVCSSEVQPHCHIDEASR